MQPSEFCHWLKNYFSIYDPYSMTQTQLIEEIKEQLDSVPNQVYTDSNTNNTFYGNASGVSFNYKAIQCSGIMSKDNVPLDIQRKLGMIGGSG